MTQAQKIAIASVVFLCLAVIGYFIFTGGPEQADPPAGDELAQQDGTPTDTTDPTLAGVRPSDADTWDDMAGTNLADAARTQLGEPPRRDDRQPTDLELTDADMAATVTTPGSAPGRIPGIAPGTTPGTTPATPGTTLGGTETTATGSTTPRTDTPAEMTSDVPRTPTRTQPAEPAVDRTPERTTTTATPARPIIDEAEMERRRQREIETILVALDQAVAQRTDSRTPATRTDRAPTTAPPATTQIGTPPTTPTRTPPATPATGTDRPQTHTVVAGDNLTSISQQYFGSARHWRAIADFNGIENPDRLRVGQTIRLPSAEQLGAGRAPATDRAAPTTPTVRPAPPTTATPRPATPPAATGPSRTHTVAENETLWKIAEQYYGEGANWRLIFDANRNLLGDRPDALKVGMNLVIPPRPANLP